MSLVPVASIWAEDRRGVIGDGARMLWRVPADFQHFRALTWGCPVIMGRKSWQALPKALPGRLNIVISRQESFRKHLAEQLEEQLGGQLAERAEGQLAEQSARCSTGQLAEQSAKRSGGQLAECSVGRSVKQPAERLAKTSRQDAQDECGFRAETASLTVSPLVQVAVSLENAIHLAREAVSSNLLVPGRKLSGSSGGGRASGIASGKSAEGRERSELGTDAERVQRFEHCESGGERNENGVEAVGLGAAQRIWVVGGGQVYRQAMDVASELVVTYIDLEAVGGTVRAPHIDSKLWSPSPSCPSQLEWQPISGDARWKVVTWSRQNPA